MKFFILSLAIGISAQATTILPGESTREGGALAPFTMPHEEVAKNYFGSPSCGPCADLRARTGGTWTRTNGVSNTQAGQSSGSIR